VASHIVAERIDEWAWRRWGMRSTYPLAILGFALMILCAYGLNVAPSPDSLPRAVDEPEPWPTETPWTCGDLKPWIDVLLNLNEQQLHYLEGMAEPCHTATPYQTAIPTVTLTPTSAPILCHRCQYESECGPGYRCHRCSDGLGRCVREESRNGDCQTCVNAGR